MTTNHKDDGGAAFPVHPSAHECTDHEYMALRGMTLLDYFAIHCLPQWFGTGSPDSRAKAAYADARAMLKARGEA